MADEEAMPGVEGPLVAVTFQKNPHQKQKYLESEPKALGVTQIALSVFNISSVIVIFNNSMSMFVEELPQIIGSVFVIIAGSLAITAQNLHLPTLKACLGMQVVACVASVSNLIFSVSYMGGHNYGCWEYNDVNHTGHYKTCLSVNDSTAHYLAELVLIHTALIAISVTLAAYCCKVVNCCSPGPRMVTQIALSVFNINSVIVIFVEDLSQIIGSVFVIIAGSLAIAAQHLHLPTDSTAHYFAELVLIQTALIAISVTLAAYCCKVVNCCSPGPRMPVITVQVPPAQQ